LNLLNIANLTESQIIKIYELADQLKKDNNSKYFNGKTFILFFPASSIRTRITFEKGIKSLGGECILFPPETLDKKEDLRDVIQYIENWADGVIIRHSDYKLIESISKNSRIPIINAMTSFNHPCEILADLYSISKIKENYRDIIYTFVGENANISRSWMNIAKVMNLDFNHVCMNGYHFQDDNKNYKYHIELDSIIKNSDVVLTDSIPSVFKTKEYIDKYQITLERMKLTKQNAILCPCPPFFRNEEVSEDVIDSKYFVGHHFKKNLLYVQQAIILYCLDLKI